nr:CrtB [uncultured bacterium]
MTTAALTVCRASIAQHSKSFSLASRLLGPRERDAAAAVYAFCRRADDAVDIASDRSPVEIVATLRAELDAIYAGEVQSDPALVAFQEVVRAHHIPKDYPAELLAGMAMDVEDTTYDDLDALLVYCFRVAGTVGLMMSHVLGVREEAALHNAAHLGMAMQLTNICRDVGEDWGRGRLYLPSADLDRAGAPGLRGRLGGPLPDAARPPIARVIRALLERAELLYESGERGVPLLPFRAAVAVRTARLVYGDIGRVILEQGADPVAPRAVVSTSRKLRLALLAFARTAAQVPLEFRGAELFHVVGVHDVIPS